MWIVVIGLGILGNSVVWVLSDQYEVVFYEKCFCFGGYSVIVDIDYDGIFMFVDIGFIVYNELNYLNFIVLFDYLGVVIEFSDMSFVFLVDVGKLEWSGDSFNFVFVQCKNIVFF